MYQKKHVRKTFRRICHIKRHFDDNLTYPTRAPQDTQVTQVGSVCHVAVRLHHSVVAPEYTRRKHADGYTRCRSPTAPGPVRGREATGGEHWYEHTRHAHADSSPESVLQSVSPRATICVDQVGLAQLLQH